MEKINKKIAFIILKKFYSKIFILSSATSMNNFVGILSTNSDTIKRRTIAHVKNTHCLDICYKRLPNASSIYLLNLQILIVPQIVNVDCEMLQ